MKRTWTVAVLALALAGIAAACIGRIREPEVRLVGVRVGGIGLQGGLLYAQLSVVNPNRFGLEAVGLTYDLDVTDPDAADGGWLDFAEGDFREEFRVPAYDSATVEVPIQFLYAGVGGAIRSMMDMGTFDYRVSGTVSLRDPVRTSVPYRRQGTVSFAGVR